jgi:hypothetical protein
LCINEVSEKNKKNLHFKILAEILREIFEKEVFSKLLDKDISEKSLDERTLKLLKGRTFEAEDKKKTIKTTLKFSEPKDEIYKAEEGRTPYDILCYGKINNKNFKIFINNKFGDLYSIARNDITTYNNLIRLYLDIRQQRLKSKITIDKNKIYKRILGKEIISYGVFVFDRQKRGFNFFLLEEIEEEFYINPQISKMPSDYYSFVIKLVDAIIGSLIKSKASIEREILVLKMIKKEISSLIQNDQ